MRRSLASAALGAALVLGLPLGGPLACDAGSRPSAARAAEGSGAAPGSAAGSRHEGEASSGGSHEGGAHEGGTHAEGTHAGAREIALSREQRSRLELEVTEAEAGSARGTVRTPATVAFDADRTYKVGPRLRAKVLRVTKDLGDSVEAGETLAVLDSVALGKAKARFLTAEARLATERAEYERERRLAEKQISSEAERLEARARYHEARAERDAAREELRLYGLTPARIDGIEAGGDEPLSRYRLAAPGPGLVQRRDLAPGDTLSPSDTPIHVVDTSRVWVFAEAFERDLPLLEAGLRLALSVRALPDRRFSGRVDWVSRELDEKNRTVRVRAVVENPEGLLRAGMFGTARLRTERDAKSALVPVDAVQTIAGDEVVFVPGAEAGTFRAVPVRLGAEQDGRVEIRSGLAPGERLVVAGAFDLKAALTARGRSAAHGH